MTQETTQSWRRTILGTLLLEEGELHMDVLHESANDDEELEQAEAAVEVLASEGIVRLAENGTITLADRTRAEAEMAAGIQ